MASRDADPVPVGPLLDMYDQKENIGKGSFSSVCIYKLKESHVQSNSQLPTKMAVKIIAFKVNFREIDICAHTHKHVVKFYGVEVSKSLTHIKMEVANCNLKCLQDEIIEGSLAHSDFLYLALQVAEGLGSLHGKNITHRDIKRENILVFWNGPTDKKKKNLRNVTLKLCDFGLSRFNPNDSATMTTVGTLKYTAPEVATALNVEDGTVHVNYKKVDVFSLGVVYYKLLFDEVPFSKSQLVDKARKHVDIARFRGENIEQFGALLSQMLCWNSEERISVSCVIFVIRSFSGLDENGRLYSALNAANQNVERQQKYIAQLERQISEHTKIRRSNDVLHGPSVSIGQTTEQDRSLKNQKKKSKKRSKEPSPEADEVVYRKSSATSSAQEGSHGPPPFDRLRNAAISLSNSLRPKATPLQMDKVDDGMNALHKAAQSGGLRDVRWLLDSGDDVNRVSTTGDMTPLHYACESGHHHVAQLLIRKGADVHADSKAGGTPLHLACVNGHLLVAQLLVEKGADTNRDSKYKGTPLHSACEAGHVTIVQLLVERGADVNAYSESLASPLHVACEWGHLSVAQILFERGAGINSCSKLNPMAPLHIACKFGHMPVAQWLIERGAEVNSNSILKKTPLHLACESNHLPTANLLVERGADINGVSECEGTSLHIACRRGHLSVAQMLLEKGAAVNAESVGNETPLHSACAKGHLAVAQLLTENGADVNRADEDGRTPLELANKNDHLKVVAFLLKCGALKCANCASGSRK